MERVLIAFEPPDGGVPEHVAHLALGAPPHGWDVEVAGPQQATVYPQLEAAGVPIHRIAPLRRGYRRPWDDAAALRRFRNLLRSGRFDLIHCHASKAGFFGRLAALGTKTATVYTPHGFGFVGDVSPIRRHAVPPVERLLARRTDALICVCDAELHETERRRIGSTETRRRVYNGCAACQADTPFDSGLATGLTVGAISVFRPEKGIDVLIDAAPQILSAVPDAGIVIVGNGALRAVLEDRARRAGLIDHPRFALVPFSPPSDRYLRTLDVFVLPSVWDAFPVSALQALACGVAQVASDVGGIPEAVTQDTGILVPPRDPGRLAQAVTDLLQDAKRRSEMSRAAVERHGERFQLTRMAADTEAVYREALSRRARAITTAERPSGSVGDAE
jgi:glycosyltransferase involved in cell wall biosynthesis